MAVPKIELFCPYFFLVFLFFFFSFYFLHVFCLELFLLGFVICCINLNLYFLDEESSRLWSLAQGIRWWAIWTISEKIQTGDREGWGHRFSRYIKERTCRSFRVQLKKVEFPGVFMKISWNFHWYWSWVLTFGISTNKGSVSIRSGESGKVREFVSGSGKVREIRYFLEKVREKLKRKIFIHANF